MFKKILQLISENRMISKAQLARVIGISKETLEDILTMLADRGYLRVERPTSCDTAQCSGCPHASHCSDPNEGITYYTITEQGTRYGAE